MSMELPGEFTRPLYKNGSIANIPATVASLLDVPFAGLGALRGELWQPLAGGVKRVVVLVVDAMGWNLLEKERPFLTPFLNRAHITGQLTSVFPSTTVAALSSIWTGAAPAQHGLVGLRMFFPEYATVGQMLKLSPALGTYPDALVKAGLDPKTFLHTLGVGEQLAEAGVATHAYKGRHIVESALSRMHGRGVAGNHGVISFADMLVQMRELLESERETPLYLNGYWSPVDSLSHAYGWTGTAVSAELHTILYQIETQFINALSPEARKGTLLFITADHGQVVTPPEKKIFVEDHPQLQEMLLMRPFGEPRVVYLYVKQGKVETAVDYINTHLSHAMIAWRTDQALAAGLLGAKPHAPQSASRMGDIMVTMRDDYALLPERPDKDKKPFEFRGRHGGMTQAEMTVPWLGFRLDSLDE